MNLKELLNGAYARKVIYLLKLVGREAEKLGAEAYLVGGPVRDLFFDRLKYDLDIAVENCPVKEFIERILAVTEHRDYEFHHKFNTATIFLSDNTHMDFANTRSEIYIKPGALPDVMPAGITDDLKRRDFTINAMAIGLNADRFGELIDPYGGLDDLKKKKLRVLHTRSFADDPTRILRGARFIVRFNLGFSQQTLLLVQEAVANKYLTNVSQERITQELIKILDERKTGKCLKLLAKYGMKIPIFSLPQNKLKILNHRFLRREGVPVLVKLALLFYPLSVKKIKLKLKSLKLSRKIVNEICSVFSFIEGDRTVKNLPEWSEDFFKIVKFSYRKNFVTGDDLIKLGFKPGPLFKKILLDVNKKQNLITHKRDVDYIMNKYQKSVEC